MLRSIHIRDFAIVEGLELDFEAGLTVLTGETGAGKSILLDALGLALGDRADSAHVRAGADRAEVNAEFDTTGLETVQAWLVEQELDEDEPELRVRRTVGADGRSRAWINGRPVAISALRELGERLVDIHGQHAHQSLLRREAQRDRVDEYAGAHELRTRVAAAHRREREIASELAALQQADSDREARRELLAYQVEELEALGLEEGEPDRLEAEHERLSHARQLLEACERAIAVLHEGEEITAAGLLGRTTSELGSLREVDAGLGPAADLVESAAVQVNEATTELRHYRDGLELDPERLAAVEQRLDTAHELARKHRCELDELPGLLPRLSEELDGLDASGDRLQRLEAERATAAAEYREAAEALTAARKAAGEALAEQVNGHLPELGLTNARFEVALEPLESPGAQGAEAVQFQVTTNPGQPLRPLQRVASGGELARISLAIQVVTARNAAIPVLVFDEVDVGIGGGVAEMVGRRLRQLGEEYQVLCVTHQPQVAAQAHNHLQVAKATDADSVETVITPLDEAERTREVARMLGGVEITDQTLSHAEEMIRRGREAAAASA